MRLPGPNLNLDRTSVRFNRFRFRTSVQNRTSASLLLGIPCKSFREMHEDKASEIMRNVVSYIQTVRAGAGTGPATGKRIMTIELNPDGFPIAPDPASLEKTTKADLETVYRRYITSHYCKLSKMHFQYDKE